MALLSSYFARCPPPHSAVPFTGLFRPWLATNRSPITVQTVDITVAFRKLRETSRQVENTPTYAYRAQSPCYLQGDLLCVCPLSFSLAGSFCFGLRGLSTLVGSVVYWVSDASTGYVVFGQRWCWLRCGCSLCWQFYGWGLGLCWRRIKSETMSFEGWCKSEICYDIMIFFLVWIKENYIL